MVHISFFVAAGPPIAKVIPDASRRSRSTVTGDYPARLRLHAAIMAVAELEENLQNNLISTI